MECDNIQSTKSEMILAELAGLFARKNHRQRVFSQTEKYNFISALSCALCRTVNGRWIGRSILFAMHCINYCLCFKGHIFYACISFEYRVEKMDARAVWVCT